MTKLHTCLVWTRARNSGLWCLLLYYVMEIEHACCRAAVWHTSALVCTNIYHSSQQRMSGQFLFYYEFEAISSDKIRDAEPPCQTVLDSAKRNCDQKASMETPF